MAVTLVGTDPTCPTPTRRRIQPFANPPLYTYMFRWTESFKKVLKKGLKKVTELKKVLKKVMKLKKGLKKVNSLKKALKKVMNSKKNSKK